MIRAILTIALLFLLLSCEQEKGNNTTQKTEHKLAQTNKEITPMPIAAIGIEKPKGVSFQVDDVPVPDFFLNTDSAKKVFENKLGRRIYFFPTEHARLVLVPSLNNGLIETLRRCYDTHRPLVLTPDVIWLAICQGVSIHINKNHKSLEKAIFASNKPKELVVREDSLEYAAKHWGRLINGLADSTCKYTKEDFYSFFVSDFSTTTAIDKTAYQITLLESYKKVFDYIGPTGCGIPTIHIAGTKQDWEMILKKLELLEKIGLETWAKNLKPIMVEFIKAAEGKPNPDFWKDIYKNASEYGAFYISGWIIKFFPYIKTTEVVGDGDADGMTGMTKVVEVYEPNEFYEDDNYLLSTLSTDNFPTGIAKIPLKWENFFKNTTKNMEICAGFFGIRQYPDKSLQPFVSWAVYEERADLVSHKIKGNKTDRLKHNPDYWSPRIAKIVTDSAIYDVKRFKTQSSSLAFVKQVILDSLRHHQIFKSAKYKNDTLQLQILTNGKIGNVSMLKSKNVKLAGYIKSALKGLPAPWFPALAHPRDVLDAMMLPEEHEKIKVRANSLVKIKL